MRTVESSFNKNTSAEEKAAKKSEVLSKQIQVQKDRVKLLAQMYEESKQKLGENDNATLKWKQALNNATTDLNKLENELEETKNTTDQYGTEVDKATDESLEFVAAAKRMEAIEKVAEVLDKVSEAAQKVASSAVDAAKELDSGYDTIIKKTGATGETLSDFKKIADDVYGTMPVSMEDVGKAVGEVNTRFKSTGSQLQSTSQDFLKFASINDTDVSDAVDQTDRLMKIFGVDTKNTRAVLGLLTKAGQDSGISFSNLSGQLDSNGATLNELGFDLISSTKLMAAFESGGVDTSSVMTALRKSVVNASKSGKNANGMLKDSVKRIKNASTETEALQIATETFGTKGAVVMAEGIRSGRINLDDATGSIEQYGDVVSNTYEATLDPWDKTAVAMNNLKRVGSDLAGEALSSLAPAIDKVADVVKNIADGFGNLPKPVKTAVGVIAGVGATAAIVGPKVLSVVKAIEGFKIARAMSKGVAALTAAETASAAGSTADAAAKTAETAATTAATTATKSFTAALLANPITMVVGAIAAFTAALVINTKRMNNSEETYEGLARSAEKANKKLEESVSETKKSSAEAAILAKTVKDLNSKEHLNATEKAKLAAAANRLNSLMPGLNLQIDTNTGKLKGNTDAIYKNIDAAVAQYRAEKNKEKINEVLDTYAENLDKQQEALKRYYEAQAQLSQATRESDAWYYYKDQVDQAKGSLDRITAATKENENQYNELLKGINAGDAILGTSAEAAEATADSYGEIGDAAGETADENGTATEEIATDWEAVKESIGRSIESSISLFEQFDGGTKISADKMEKNLDSQITGITNWQTNLSKLMEMGGDSVAGFVQMLAEQGPQSANAVQALVDGGAEKLSEISTKWNKAQEIANLGNAEGQAMLQRLGMVDTAAQTGMDSVSQTVREGWNTSRKDAQTGAQATAQAGANALSQGKAGLDSAAYNSTSGVGSQMAAGETSGAGQVQAAAQTVANYADVAPYAKSMSAQMKLVGSYITASFASGITQKGSSVGKSMKSLINQIKASRGAARKAGQEIGTQVGSGVQASNGVVRAALNMILTSVKTGVTTIRAQQSVARVAGLTIGQNIGTGIRSSNGVVKSGVSTIVATVRTLPVQVKAQSGSAKTAGTTVANNVGSGLKAGKAAVTGGVTTITDAVKGLVDKVKGVGSSAKSAGESVGGSVATGLNNKKSSVSAAASSVAGAAEGPLKAMKDKGRDWGQHLGQNFANGISDKRGAAIAAARATANAVAAILQHSTPKEGPLRDDDVWGEHLAENFARGIVAEIPAVRAAALSMARAAEVAVTPAYDPSIVSGRGALQSAITQSIDLSAAGIDTDALYSAVRSGASDAGIRLYIGERELGRVLRDMGVVFAA